MRGTILSMIMLVFAIAVCQGQSSGIQVQVSEELSKEEKKRWKQIAKDYRRDLPKLQKLVKEHEAYKEGYNSLKQEIEKLRNAEGQDDSRIEELEQEIDQLTIMLNTARSSLEKMTEEKQAVDDNYGVWFRVQIGAFEQEQMEKNLTVTGDMTVEDSDDLQKVVVGRYRDYERAKALRDQLKKMGVKGAWIVSYRDGSRVSIKEALEGF